MDAPPPGRVWIVGAGPGDPGLLTLAAARALSHADVVLYDALAAPALLRHAPPAAELVYVGKRAGSHALPQAEIEGLLVEHARAGKQVVRLKGGDPFVFGRGGEEALACRRAGIPFTVVPGVSSVVAAPAYAGIPVTHRGLASAFMAITGSGAAAEADSVDWEAAARADTLVILMGVATLAFAMERLQAAGRDPGTPAACVRWGTRPDQQVVVGSVGTIASRAAAAKLESPVVTVVGAVVGLAEALAWYTPGPLAGRRVVVTRARSSAGRLATLLEDRGAFVIEAPVVRSEPLPSFTLAGRLPAPWNWIAFTSANGVAAFFAALAGAGADARALAGVRLAAVGDATATALRENGLRPDFLPSCSSADALARELPDVAGTLVLLPLSALAGERLASSLRARGAVVEQLDAYTTLPQPLDDERLRALAEADAVAFTSGSTARALHAALGSAPLPASAKLVTMGPQTSAAVHAVFGRVDAEAREPSLSALVAALEEALTWD
ncbi:MAG: uroporphyrinogen-III C-methyltransferase [Dehalococcoidia bacterium]|nr:uroporphyrinogen-III C-methyltransferase [Dehalococcoidia bacterium]